MKNVVEIAKLIIANSVSNLSLIKSDFSEIKKKTLDLEKAITTFNGDESELSFKKIEEWKPLAEEIIESIENMMEKMDW